MVPWAVWGRRTTLEVPAWLFGCLYLTLPYRIEQSIAALWASSFLAVTIFGVCIGRLSDSAPVLQCTGLSCSSTEPIVFFPAIHVTNFFKFVLLGQRHFIESVFYLTHGVRTRLNGLMHLVRRTLSHRSQSRFDG